MSDTAVEPITRDPDASNVVSTANWSIQYIPTEVWLNVFDHLIGDNKSCAAIVLVCRRFNRIATPILYRSIELVDEFYQTMEMAQNTRFASTVHQEIRQLVQQNRPRLERKQDMLIRTLELNVAYTAHVREIQISINYENFCARFDCVLQLISLLSHYVDRLSLMCPITNNSEDIGHFMARVHHLMVVEGPVAATFENVWSSLLKLSFAKMPKDVSGSTLSLVNIPDVAAFDWYLSICGKKPQLLSSLEHIGYRSNATDDISLELILNTAAALESCEFSFRINHTHEHARIQDMVSSQQNSLQKLAIEVVFDYRSVPLSSSMFNLASFKKLKILRLTMQVLFIEEPYKAWRKWLVSTLESLEIVAPRPGYFPSGPPRRLKAINTDWLLGCIRHRESDCRARNMPTPTAFRSISYQTSYVGRSFVHLGPNFSTSDRESDNPIARKELYYLRKAAPSFEEHGVRLVWGNGLTI